MTKTAVGVLGLLLLAWAAVSVLPMYADATAGAFEEAAVSAQGVVLGNHATQKHPEAADIRNCLDDKGPYMVYKHKFSPTWYLLCEVGNGLWGLQAVAEDGAEKTAFSPGEGTWRDMMDYVNRFATKWKQGLPWIQ